MQTLRQMHVVDLETSTLCLVGARNVGKLSLVGILSTGKLKITQHKWSWPFMTPVDVQKLGLQDYHQGNEGFAALGMILHLYVFRVGLGGNRCKKMKIFTYIFDVVKI